MENNYSKELLLQFEEENCVLIKRILIGLAVATILFVFGMVGLKEHNWMTVGNVAAIQAATIIMILVLDKQMSNKHILTYILIIIMILDVYYLGSIYNQIGSYMSEFVSLFLPSVVCIIVLNKYINIYTSVICGLPFIYIFTFSTNQALLQYKELLYGVFSIYIIFVVLVYLVNSMYRKNIQNIITSNNEVLERQLKLEGVIEAVMNSADEITKASGELKEENQDLEQRTQEQSAALEETSSAMEELSTTVKLNADSANKANSMAQKTKEIVVQGNEVVRETIRAMEAVSQSSKKISEIINVVNDIAFQTNLLALNAAVEAARAGEQGRGFAVVAVEVRNLAGRSAEASKQIQNLINDSVSKVDIGNNLVLSTGEQLSKITESIQEVSNIVSDISVASKEQAVGIDEVNKAIVQMDQSTQKNASLVQESAALSQIMNNQVEELFKVIEKIKVK